MVVDHILVVVDILVVVVGDNLVVVDQGILMEPIGIKERSSIVLPVVEDKLAYLKQKEQLLEHFRKEPPIFEFLQEPQGLGLLRQHIVT